MKKIHFLTFKVIIFIVIDDKKHKLILFITRTSWIRAMPLRRLRRSPPVPLERATRTRAERACGGVGVASSLCPLGLSLAYRHVSAPELQAGGYAYRLFKARAVRFVRQQLQISMSI